MRDGWHAKRIRRGVRVRFPTPLRSLWPASWPGRAVVIAIVWGFALTALAQWRNFGSGAAPPANRPLQAPESGYATSDTCRSCHPGQYASWHASFHRTMTQLATPANIIPPLDGLELPLGGSVYRVARRGDAFFVRKGPAGAPESAFEPPREIVLLTGSHSQQNLWLETGEGRSLEPFPFGWLVAEKMWAPVGDTFLNPPELPSSRALGAWNSACINCHVTQGRARYGVAAAGVFDSRVAEFGIACESCHGEGSEHIRSNRSPLRRYFAHFTTTEDPTIANPGKMKGPESALACGQCHSIWAFKSLEAETVWNRDGPAFRPGQAELPERFVAHPTTGDHAEAKAQIRAANPHFFEDSYWGDGAVRVTGREYNGVELSPCFKGGEFSCLSCHEMHPEKTDRATLQTWAVNQMKPDATADSACLQCHESIGRDLRAHTHHAPESAGSRCYDCHMPHSNFGLLRAVRSHQVTSPTVRESVDFGRPNACNLCHLDQPLAWTADKLQAWYGQVSPELSRDDREVAASAKWLLAGDAGQRALIAWSMGWAPAQRASGTDWLAPYLAITLNDPYSAVRYVAWKSLQTLPGFGDFRFVYTADDETTFAAANYAYQRTLELRGGHPPLAPRPATLLDGTGRFRPGIYQRLLDQRNHRRVFLVE